MNKDAQMRAAINQKLIETGERERLKELLRAKLIECGWKDQLKAHCKEVIKEKGLEHVTVDDLVAEITPKGRAQFVHVPSCLGTASYRDSAILLPSPLRRLLG
uniref:Transcription and mRNA export factor ENY2 n=1 Tax=Macaca nemestrina TaxID=9545 RepID=A0A2K6CKN9_MACNE